MMLEIAISILAVTGCITMAARTARRKLSDLRDSNNRLCEHIARIEKERAALLHEVGMLKRDAYRNLVQTKGLMMMVARQSCEQDADCLRMAERVAHAMPYLAPISAQPSPELARDVLGHAEAVALQLGVVCPSLDHPALLFNCLVTVFEAVVYPDCKNLSPFAYWQRQSDSHMGVSPTGAA